MSDSSSFPGFDFDLPDDCWLARVRSAVKPGDGNRSSVTDAGGHETGYAAGERLGP